MGNDEEPVGGGDAKRTLKPFARITSLPVHAVTQKPMSWHDNIEEPADGEGNDPCPPTAGAGGGSVVSF